MIHVIDSPMGYGKTLWAISFIRKLIEQRRQCIFVTPYIDEVKRIKAACPTFCEGLKHMKFQSVKEYIKQGKNVVCTHQCFLMADEDFITLVRESKIVLVLDEVADMVQEVNIAVSDIEIMLRIGINSTHL